MSQRNQITLSWSDENGDEIEHAFPSINEVCARCEGFGTHLTPSIGEHAYSMEEFYESFPEDEDREQYFRHGGIYDVKCEECGGKNVVPVVDEGHLDAQQKELYADYCRSEDQRAQDAEQDRATYRMESGVW